MENSSYTVHLITDTKGKSDEELEEEFWNDEIGFIKTHCQE